MPVETDADRLGFVSSADFGASVSWVVGAGEPVVFDALFLSGAVDQQVGDGADARNAVATLLFPAALLPAGADAGEDAITVRGVAYTLKDLRDDGAGMLVVRLEVAE